MGNKSATLNVLMIGNADEEAHPKEFYDSLGIGRKRFLVGDKLATTEEEMSKCSEYFHIGTDFIRFKSFYQKLAAENKHNCKISSICTMTPTKSILTKECILSTVRKWFGKAASEKGKQRVIIYYTGHGWKGSGDWVCLDEIGGMCSISIFDILDIAIEEGFKQGINIITDSCYSGHWVIKIQELFLNDNKYTGKFEYLYIDTSCKPDEPAIWGVYAERFGGQGWDYIYKYQTPCYCII